MVITYMYCIILLNVKPENSPYKSMIEHQTTGHNFFFQRIYSIYKTD